MDILLTVRAKADSSVQEVRRALEGPLILGRGPDSAVPLDGPGISREHLAFQAEDSALVVTDLSSNGTWINGERLARGKKRKVNPADSVELPGFEVRIRIVGAPAAAGLPAAERAEPSAAATVRLERMNVAPAAAAAAGPTAAARSALASLTRLEWFLILIALMSLGILATYLAG